MLVIPWACNVAAAVTMIAIATRFENVSRLGCAPGRAQYMGKLEGKIALIIGGSSGIGLGMPRQARQIVRKGRTYDRTRPGRQNAIQPLRRRGPFSNRVSFVNGFLSPPRVTVLSA